MASLKIEKPVEKLVEKPAGSQPSGQVKKEPAAKSSGRTPKAPASKPAPKKTEKSKPKKKASSNK